MTMQAECILEAEAILGEGPLWDPERQVLWWIDITEGVVHRFDPHTSEDTASTVGQMVGALALRTDGTLLLAAQHGFAVFDPDTDALEMLSTSLTLAPDMRFNDAKCGPAGRFWAGTMHLEAFPERGSLYCLDADLTTRRMLRYVSISNGLAWSADGHTMYYIDSPTRQVAAFDFDPERGQLSNRRFVVIVPPEQGDPDGMTIDRDGKLWIAHYGGACVARWDPVNGRRLQTVALPAAQVTCCTFGGPQLDQLYITTAREGLTLEELKAQPLAGSLFCVRPGISGRKTVSFAG